MVASIALSALLLVRASEGHAAPEFPSMVGELLEMACTPPCTICHRDNNGGYGTLRTTEDGQPGFGAMLRARYGLDPRDTATLRPALRQALIDGLDVDLDGAVDVYELADGTDPNSAGGELRCGPEYGCFASVSAVESGGSRAFVVLVALALAVVLRRAGRGVSL